MEVVLIILGILGFGAIVIAAYVFTVAARNYVSHDHDHGAPATSDQEGYIVRNGRDRRRGVPVSFPLTVNSVVVERDRRHSPERRAAA